ncbi:MULTISPECIES: urease accessory protein UreD [unclassified Moorena]|uniref:urease accessory protein UreD n=1 Tax=unclassified Moorena TaxID=2683338 RepID=UPI001400187E|nr:MULTISPECIES: urease accessory protein UreD [unclassified Moorena]NEO11823.1 urease accessory protein UreD [Moorena sp. SIO3E8]NEP98742.1 urease accessory protein UreD [Moorena sp. SIO3F7]
MNQLSQPQPTDSDQSRWHGSLELRFAYCQGQTQPIHTYAKAPLKVQRPFYPEGLEVCHSVVLHTAGGMVAGDKLSQDIQLESGTHALITTAAASKAYGRGSSSARLINYSTNNEKLSGSLNKPEPRKNISSANQVNYSASLKKPETRQIIRLQVETGACLEWLPQETIVFNGAVYRQDLRVELAPGASWLGWEITRFGRSARGERFVEGNWRSHTEVWQQGHPTWIDRQWLPASEATFSSPYGLAGQPVVGTLALVGEPVSSEILEQARELWSAREYVGEAGVTQLMSGLLCRYRGASTEEVRHWFTEVWQLLRVNLFGRPIIKPRVWPL